YLYVTYIKPAVLPNRFYTRQRCTISPTNRTAIVDRGRLGEAQMEHPNVTQSDIGNGSDRRDIGCAELQDGPAMQAAVLNEVLWAIAIFLGIAAAANALVLG